ncbi:hypothetical protein M3Y99_00743000 [Aphelenchoides fujianensis]|nr:hypothetical protein M3Y99_00743000 [Aphelenchoides fujianensis]
MCGGHANCALRPNKLLPECLPKTCKQPAWQRKAECRAYCRKHRGVCSSAADCSTADRKFTPACIAETCAKPEERQQTACVEHCRQTPAAPECSATPAECAAGDQACWSRKCADAAERSTPPCVQFCTATPADPSCTAAPTAGLCDQPEHFRNESCLGEFCSRNETTKTTEDCQLYCGRQPANATACTGVTAKNCDEAPAKDEAVCLPHTCRKQTEKANPACVAFCDQNPANSSCVGVQPATQANCDAPAQDADKYTDPCGLYTCRKTAAKTSDGCKTYCNADDKKGHASCAGVDPVADNNCENPVPPATKYDATCAPYTCRKTTEKTNDGCKQWCVDKAAAAECRDVEPPADANCDPDDKKYTDECLPYTCRKTTEKSRPECDNFCRARPGHDTCHFFL